MNIVELAKDYQNRGWFLNMTSNQINKEIGKLNLEILRADKRTYNGKMTRTFNKSQIAIAEIILEAIDNGYEVLESI